MTGIEFIDLDKKYLDEAVALAKFEYGYAKDAIPVIGCDGVDSLIEAGAKNVFEHGVGKLALRDGRLVGYVGFYAPLKGFHGDVNGAFSPLGASAFTGKELSGIDRNKLVELLLTTSLNTLARNGIFSVGFSCYSSDRELLSALVMNGFGIRSGSALAEMESVEKIGCEFPIRELKGEERKLIIPLSRKLREHLSSSPVFIPDMNAPEDYEKNVLDESRRIFAAFDGEEAVGCICSKESGESFVSDADEISNMCGFYVSPEYRKKGLAKALVSYFSETFEKEGYKKIGVDFETLNPSALRFYNKLFTTYTYSLIRRIDERIVG